MPWFTLISRMADMLTVMKRHNLYYDYQLQWVLQNGVADAAGEMGLVNEQTIIPVGSKYMKASKYTWFDRWNMLF